MPTRINLHYGVYLLVQRVEGGVRLSLPAGPSKPKLAVTVSEATWRELEPRIDRQRFIGGPAGVRRLLAEVVT